eukprot:3420123-Alexandrium_andersonii.AAC.1
MSASLVGSEMCIRDRLCGARVCPPRRRHTRAGIQEVRIELVRATVLAPVSYTHLTLPTICSV